MDIGFRRICSAVSYVVWGFLTIGILIFFAFRWIPSYQDRIFYDIVDPYTRCFTVATLLLWPVQPTLCVISTVRASLHHAERRYIVRPIVSLMISLVLWVTVLGMWIQWTGV